jgi:hypothetical protein
MSDTPETDAFMTRIRGIDGDKHWVPADTAKRLERERASAIKKIQRQAERIRQLEGATNYAGGKPLSIALKERDEAREELATLCREKCRDQRERDEAREQIDNIRKKLSESGEAVGNGDYDYAIIDMIENLIKSKDYFVRKSDSLERERDEAITRRMETIMQCELYEQERDEARQQYDDLATEHMLAVNKLCNERDILRIDAQKEAEHHDKMVGELENLYDKLTKSVELIKLLIKQVEYPAYTVDEVVEKMFLMDKAKRFIK